MSILVLASYVHAHCLQVDRLPMRGESLHSDKLWSEHGGKGLNVALGVHRLGVKVDALLPLGADGAAVSVRRLLQDEKLDSRWALQIGAQSGYGVGFVAPNGENFLAVYPGANALLTAEHVEPALAELTRADWVYAQFEIPDAPILAAFRKARERASRTLLNPSPWRLPDPELLALTDILLVNETEAALLFGQAKSPDLTPNQWLNSLPGWARQCGWRGELLIVTLGGLGCVALTPETVIYQPAWRINRIDGTGAGDAFSAGLVAAFMRGLTASEALKLACACGAWVAAKQGILQHLPTWTEVSSFMQSQTIPKEAVIRLQPPLA